jgi:hypothetical protein
MVLPEGSVFQETNGAKLKQGGVKGCQEMLEEVKRREGVSFLLMRHIN